MAGGFGEADVAGMTVSKSRLPKCCLSCSLTSTTRRLAAVVHGADDAGYVEVGVDGLADFADGGH